MKTLVRSFVVSAIVALSPVSVCFAQAPTPPKPMPSMPSMSGMEMPGMKMPMMTMSSSTDLLDPMSREGSGTAWLPDATPIYGGMTMTPNGDMLMIHGAAMPRYTDIGSKRGDRRFDAPNWAMGMFSHKLDQKSQLGLRLMMSLDPITEGGYGYPLLFQTGESWHHQPLHDRQHPHDLFDEVSATYSRKIGGGNSAYLYLADPGEPALGPPTYMHRLIAYDLPDAPIGHHWQDATHITFGVVTAGMNLGDKFKFEGSDFTGREPNEDRYNFDTPRFDSYSGRLSFNPNAQNSFQVSTGFIKNAEGDGVNQHRITASWIYDKPLGDDANVTTSLVWGQNNLTTEGRSNSYLAEADYQNKANTLFTRIENIQKSGHELVLPVPLDTARKFTLGEITVGYVRDVTHGKGIDTGIGGAVTVNTKPSDLDEIYGNGSPVSFQVFVRFRPSRLGGHHKMAMSESDSLGSMPGMSMPEATPAPSVPAPAPVPMPVPFAPATSPAPPVPSQVAPAASANASPMSSVQMPISVAASLPSPKVGKNSLTITVFGSDGKPLDGAALKTSVEMTEMDMGTSHPALVPKGSGQYAGTVTFGMAGSWRVTVKAIVPGSAKLVTKSFVYTAK